jgi:hypothetical protein
MRSKFGLQLKNLPTKISDAVFNLKSLENEYHFPLFFSFLNKNKRDFNGIVVSVTEVMHGHVSDDRQCHPPPLPLNEPITARSQIFRFIACFIENMSFIRRIFTKVCILRNFKV